MTVEITCECNNCRSDMDTGDNVYCSSCYEDLQSQIDDLRNNHHDSDCETCDEHYHEIEGLKSKIKSLEAQLNEGF